MAAEAGYMGTGIAKNKCSFVTVLLVEYKRGDNLPVQEINDLREQFINQLMPLKIYLFGSFAEGTYTEESDFDFYIIVDDEIKNLKDITTQAYRSIRKIKNRPVDIVVGTTSRFEARKTIPSIENEVYEKGVLLYESGSQKMDLIGEKV